MNRFLTDIRILPDQLARRERRRRMGDCCGGSRKYLGYSRSCSLSQWISPFGDRMNLSRLKPM